jgi:hypothetical protein
VSNCYSCNAEGCQDDYNAKIGSAHLSKVISIKKMLICLTTH